MLYEIETRNKNNNKATYLEAEEVITDFLGDTELFQIGIPDGSGVKWFDKFDYTVVVREAYTGRRIITLE